MYIEGRLSTRKWQDKDGKDRYSTEIVADRVQFIGGGTGGGGGGGREFEDQSLEPPPPGGGGDDIPF